MCHRILACAVVMAMGAQVGATDWTNGAGDGDWSNPANWSPILPEAGERVDIESTSAMGWPTLNGGVVNCGQVRLGYEDGTDGELTVTGGAILTVGGELRIARKDGPPKTTGTLNVSGADTEIHVTQRLVCGRYGDAVINMTGGLLQTDAELRIGFRDDASGRIYLGGGTLDIAADPGITIGQGADDVGSVTALIDISGDGTLVLAGDQYGLIETLVNDGTIVGYGGTRPVKFAYDGDNTVVTSVNPVKAVAPVPENNGSDVLPATVLTWQSAEGVPPTGGHRIFLSLDANGVAQGIGGMIQDTNEYVPSELLAYETTYYWRVDEATATGAWHEGDVWSFQVEPFSREIPSESILATAASHSAAQGPENTIGGVGLGEDDVHSQDVTTMWLSDTSEPNQAWIQYTLDKMYKIDQLLVWNHNGQAEEVVGFGIKEALIEYSLDGLQWTAWGVAELARASNSPPHAVNLQGLVARSVRITAQSNWGGLFAKYGLSEVRFMAIPVLARLPEPVSGQTDVSPDVTLTWRAGREAVTHDVYVGTDPNALTLADTVSENRFSTFPLDLQLDQTYFWRVDEVNEAETPSVWPGEIAEFSTVEVKSVDDFEAYGNDPNTYSRVFQTWIDGAGYTNPVTVPGNGSGSFIGHDPAFGNIMEKAVFHDGRQSAPIYFGNGNNTVSEVIRTFDTAQSWSRAGAQGLVLYFYGDPDNAPVQLYVKIGSKRIDYDGDMESLQRVSWQKWYIPLGDHLSSTDLAQVKSMTIGVEGNGTGLFFVDDITLTADSRTVIIPTEPSLDNLVSHYAFDGDASDSTGAHPGDVKGLSRFEAGKVGQAISLAGLFGDYVELPGFTGILGSGEITIMAWIKTNATDTGTIMAWGPEVDGNRFGFRVNENRIRGEFSGGNVQGDAIVNDGGWHHVAMTVQANATISYPEVILYVDGQDDTRPTVDDTVVDLAADKDARIGSRPSSEDRWFGGQIDELYLYDRALTAEEIAGAAGRVASFDR